MRKTRGGASRHGVGDHAQRPVSTFYVEGPLEPGRTAVLPEAAAHHVRVKRLATGERVGVTDGAGRLALGTITRIARASVDVAVDSVREVPRPAPLVLYAPVGDRDRMLWLAEKAAELAVTEWRPVVFNRSRSVSPRGEGATFAAKVRARMIAALEQSGGAWLPAVHPEVSAGEAAAAVRPEARYLLDAAGGRFDAAGARDGAAVALGPEGGMEPDERARFIAAGWRPVALAATILRFETAGIAALAILRAAHTPLVEGSDG